MSRIPKIGEKLHFFDNGKLQNNRHYIAECVKILTPEEAKNYKLSTGDSLYNQWKYEYEEFKMFYKHSTDYFIGCSIPEYVDYTVWFVRSYYDDNWIMLDIYDDLTCGILDTDYELYKKGMYLFGEDYYTETLGPIKDDYCSYSNAKNFLEDSEKYDNICYYLDETEPYRVSIDGFNNITLILFDEKCQFKSYYYMSLEQFFERCKWTDGSFCGKKIK